MRTILVDWLIDVHKKFKLREQTLFIAINLIDRYLEKTSIQKSRFQLLGITALFVASKYEEIYPPGLAEYTYVCADAYKDSDLLDMEEKLLNLLGFNLVFTSSFALIETYTQNGTFDLIFRGDKGQGVQSDALFDSFSSVELKHLQDRTNSNFSCCCLPYSQIDEQEFREIEIPQML